MTQTSKGEPPTLTEMQWEIATKAIADGFYVYLEPDDTLVITSLPRKD